MPDKKRIILVSSCLAGINTNYRGGNSEHPAIIELLMSGSALPVCPEQLAGLTTPRLPSEIEGGNVQQVLDGRGKVVMSDGRDITSNLIHGAEEVLRLALIVKPACIVFQEHSPSCGVNYVYNGAFNNTIVPGCGLTTAILKRQGFTVCTLEEYLESYV